MPNNPVQIVLNSDNFIDDMESGGRGRRKDFFANRDQEFAAHRAAISAQIQETRQGLLATDQAFGYAKVQVNTEALAKSHRPTGVLFPEDLTPVVGVSDLGELLVEVSPASLQSVFNVAQSAELTTTMAPLRDGKETPNPSRARSEVGAVDRISGYLPSDKRKFSAVTAVEWLSNPRSGNFLIVQLFRPLTDLTPLVQTPRVLLQVREYERLRKNLETMAPGIDFQTPSDWWIDTGHIALILPQNQDGSGVTVDSLQDLLDVLERSPLVRKIHLPPIVEGVEGLPIAAPAQGSMPFAVPTPSGEHAIVGLIDTGIAPIEPLKPWIVDSVDMVDPVLQDQSHGTFIAGLLTDSSFLNQFAELNERPVKIFDLGLHVTSPYEAVKVYRNSFLDFLGQLRFEVKEAVIAGVRVFNMSLARLFCIEDDSYSIFASLLDDIVDRNDIIMVIVAGNLKDNLPREPWSSSADEVLAMLANYRYPGADRIYQPGESLRSVTVGALDPASGPRSVVKPSRYTRRGPGVGFGVKPDLAHLGGSAESDGRLRSFAPDGTLVTNCGTSFAAPMVTKTLANIDHAIEGTVRRETVIALGVHGATYPEHLKNRKLNSVVRDFVGFGMPANAESCLSTDDSAITLVFESIIYSRKELDFTFQWPESLTSPGGKCRGTARLTLVYTPPLDVKFGSEIVRVNVEAYLRQEHIDRKTGEIKYEGFFSNRGVKGIEKHRVEHGLKWSTIKQWERPTGRIGVGNSSLWKLVVNPLARSGVQLPEEGVPFTAILTISDPTGVAPVFNQMRRTLQATNVQITDIRTANRIRTRA